MPDVVDHGVIFEQRSTSAEYEYRTAGRLPTDKNSRCGSIFAGGGYVLAVVVVRVIY
jgi:hypothetical protein